MKVVKYILKKLVTIIVICFIVSIFVFFALRLNEATPISVIIGNKQSTEELRNQYMKQFYLDKPLVQQYWIWLSSVLRGDLGVDYIQKQSISMQIATRLPVTIGLVLMSSVIGTILAVIIGVLAAVKEGTAVDSVLSIFMLFFASIPSFVICILTVIFLATFVPNYSFIGSYSNFGEYMSRISVPAVIMSLSMLSFLGRVTRSSMISQLQAPYILTVEAKGLGYYTRTYKHAFKNAVIPVLTIAGYMFASSVGSSVLVEQIFSLPGIGSMLINGVQQNNYPVVQILVMIILIIYLVMSFVVDVLYAVVDPRVEISG